MSVPRVIIVGGGFGGLYAARGLNRATVNVTLIDKRNYHLFRPMLYQVATGLLSADQISGPLRSILSRQKNVDVLMDEVTGIDPKERTVQLRQRALSYDFLILATGIQYNYFGHGEWRSFAPGLESLDDADLIRGKILLAFERAEEMAYLGLAGNEAIHRELTFALAGAGTVGVEMASTLAEMSRMALARDFRHIDPTSARILLYEAGPRVLPTYPADLSTKARRHLESLGVQVHTNARVTDVSPLGIVVNGQRVPAGTVLWSAGVVASQVGQWLKVPTDSYGKVIVGPDLSIPGYPEVFVIGDTAHVVAPARNLLGIKERAPMVLPGVAQPAIQGGEYVAEVIRRRVDERSPPAPFWYWDKRGSRDRRPHVCSCGFTVCPVCRLHRLAPLGAGAHIFPHWIRESVVRVAAVGTRILDEATPSQGFSDAFRTEASLTLNFEWKVQSGGRWDGLPLAGSIRGCRTRRSRRNAWKNWGVTSPACPLSRQMIPKKEQQSSWSG